MKRYPAADQLLHNTSLCVTGDELVMMGLSRKIFSNALKICQKHCTCLSGALFTFLGLQTRYFKRFKNLPLADGVIHVCPYMLFLHSFGFFPAGSNMCCCG